MVVATPCRLQGATHISTHGPFHSLTDAGKQALTDQLRRGVSVRRAAGELELNYGHALNYAHALGFGYQRSTDHKALARAVGLVASETSLSQAADQCGVNLTAVFHAATNAGVHHPRTLPRGSAATTRRVEYLRLRQSAFTLTDAAAACGISIRTAQDFDKCLVKPKTGPRVRFIPQGPDAVTYNRLMTALLTVTDVIEPGRQAEPAVSPLIDPYREISSRYLSLIEREHIFDLHKAGHGVRATARILGRSASTIS